MSAYMLRAHGGSRDIVTTQRKGGLVLSGIITDTMVNSPRAVHMKSLENLVANTTGIERQTPMMEGVIASTVPGSMRTTSELMPAMGKDATASKMAVGRSFPGAKSGYGGAERSMKGKSKKGM